MISLMFVLSFDICSALLQLSSMTMDSFVVMYGISVNLCNIAHLINPVVLVVDEGTVSAGQ